MKRLLVVLSIIMMVMAFGEGASATLVNGGFETGDFTGWTLSAETVGTTTSWSMYDGTTLNPVEGTWLGYIRGGSFSSTLQTSIQAVNLNAGDKLSGWVAFDGRGYLPNNDYAQISVNNTMVWSTDIQSVGDYGHMLWTYWEYVAPSAGNYTLTLGVASVSNMWPNPNSAVIFDANQVTSAVPLPGTLLPLGSGLLGLAGWRRFIGQ